MRERGRKSERKGERGREKKPRIRLGERETRKDGSEREREGGGGGGGRKRQE